MNVLLITLDQFRADCLSIAGHPVVKTPNLDRLAARGVRFENHYSQAAPCAPGRASLYTGMYQMNHRVVANGTPLEDRFDNIARAAIRGGYTPVLFGYTDQGIDPMLADSLDDPRLDTYEGVLSGFTAILPLDGRQQGWVDYLKALGFAVTSGHQALATEPLRPAEHSVSAFLTTGLLEWIAATDTPWFAHASYIRPHPPYAAAGEYSTMYADAPIEQPIAPGTELHGLHQIALTLPEIAAPTDPSEMEALIRQYFGMVSEVDAQIGRILDHLEEHKILDNTVIILTSDHGEQLGDHGLLEKLGFFEQSYRSPCIVSDPSRKQVHGSTVAAFTENVDVFPTILDLFEADPLPQCDGTSLLPFLEGNTPNRWRTAAHYEWDWRYLLVGEHRVGGPIDERLEQCNLVVHRTSSYAYVVFGDGETLLFDLQVDPTWRTAVDDPALELRMARELLQWRANHLGGVYTGLLLNAKREGRWPALAH